MDLKRVDNIYQKDKDVVNGYTKQVQSLLPSNNPYFNIVILIQNLILLYYHHTFESEIFNEEYETKFLNLLRQTNKLIADKSWQLIFNSSKDGFKRSKFIEKVHGKENVLLVFELNGECIVGGYTKTGWDAGLDVGCKWNGDKDAFVFYLLSPQNHDPFVSNIKQDEEYFAEAICHHDDYMHYLEVGGLLLLMEEIVNLICNIILIIIMNHLSMLKISIWCP